MVQQSIVIHDPARSDASRTRLDPPKCKLQMNWIAEGRLRWLVFGMLRKVFALCDSGSHRLMRETRPWMLHYFVPGSGSYARFSRTQVHRASCKLPYLSSDGTPYRAPNCGGGEARTCGARMSEHSFSMIAFDLLLLCAILYDCASSRMTVVFQADTSDLLIFNQQNVVSPYQDVFDLRRVCGSATGKQRLVAL
jgi:hypothetical protein